jgi:MFS family permease
VSNIGSWMHDTAAGWLMTTLAPDPLWVALVQAATTLPVCLLALPAGTLADRFDRRRLLLGVQAAMLVVAALLGLAVLRGVVTAPVLLGFTLLLGCGTALLSPAWQAILPQLVPRPDLPAAVSLHAVGMNISRAIGPAIGGLLIVAAGIAWPFFVNAVSFVGVLVALWLWRPAAPAGPRPGAGRGFWQALGDGLSHARGNARLRVTLWRSLLFYLFASVYWALLPLVVREHFGGEARLFGVVVGCIGVGAVAGALGLPRLRARYGLEGTLRLGTAGTVTALLGFALGRGPVVGLLTSLVAGAAWLAALSSLNVAAQLALPDTFRARGMSLYTAVFYGCLAAGSVLWGQFARLTGLQAALLVAASLLALTPWRAPRLASPA